MPFMTTTAAPDKLANPRFRILIVEDSEHDRRMVRRILEGTGEGYGLVECEDARSALEIIKRESFDLVLTDLNLPGEDGISLIRQAQADLGDAGAIILTGSTNLGSAIEALRLRVMDYISKEPRETLRDILPQRVKSALAQIGLIRENRRLEQELRLRLAHLEQLHEHIPATLVATIDAGQVVREINPQARSFLGVDESVPLKGRPIGDVLDHLSSEAGETVKRLLAEEQSARNTYLDTEAGTGQGRLLLLSLTPLVAEAGEERVWILTLTDATPQQAAGLPSESDAFHGLIGRDPSMIEIRNLIRRVGPMPSSVLITGPTGSGKEVIAHAIHECSDRAEKPFIAVNCTALSREILESELFGHVRGAFTGAITSRNGRFREADGGTLFLDEIGDTAESFQTKLLRTLENGEIEPVGQDRPVKVNVRIICATNQDLWDLVQKGKFRKDLYYRINVVKIDVPPLAERPGDLMLMVEAFRKEFNHRFRKSIRFVSPEAMRALACHDWPGNVRELRHVLEHAFVVADGPTITRKDLPDQIACGSVSPARPGRSEPAAPLISEDDAPEAMDESAHIRAILSETHGNIGRTAERLSMHRTTLWRKMKQYGIDVPRAGN